MLNNLEVMVGKFTFTVAPDRWYTSQGVWAKEVGALIRIGLSDFLQQHSGDVAFVEVKPVGTVLARESEIAAVETIKVNITLSSPIAGKIVRANPLMESAPEIINQDPYGEGWVCELEAAGWETDHAGLLDAPAYFSLVKREAEGEAKKND